MPSCLSWRLDANANTAGTLFLDSFAHALLLWEHSLRYLFHLAFRCGSLGLFTVGILDSSVLILPFGNDFLLLGLSASHISHVPLYVVAATLGSVCGVAVTLWLSRKAGEKVSKQHKGGAWKYVQKHTQRRGGLALTFASVMPPPFPFTMFVAAASDLRDRKSVV